MGKDKVYIWIILSSEYSPFKSRNLFPPSAVNHYRDATVPCVFKKGAKNRVIYRYPEKGWMYLQCVWRELFEFFKVVRPYPEGKLKDQFSVNTLQFLGKAPVVTRICRHYQGPKCTQALVQFDEFLKVRTASAEIRDCPLTNMHVKVKEVHDKDSLWYDLLGDYTRGGGLFPSVSITIMAFNEEKTIQEQVHHTISFFEARGIDFEVIVVDDGSFDRTAQKVSSIKDERVRLIRHPQNMGMGVSIRDGYTASTKEFVTQLPGDMQVTADEFEPFLPLLESYDLILSTYKERRDGLLRKCISLGFRFVTWSVLGYWCSITGTMFIRRSLIEHLPMLSRTFLINCEIPLRLIRKGIVPAYVQIHAAPRGHGKSKVLNLKRISRVLKEIYALRREL